MKATTVIKSILGLIYTTIVIGAIYFGAIWLTQYIIRLNWLGTVIFWLIGIPVVVGLLQTASSFLAMPVAHLLKGAKWLCWFLLLPALFFLYSFGYFLWTLASALGDIKSWLLLISWFFEMAWLFVAYFLVAEVSAYEIE